MRPYSQKLTIILNNVAAAMGDDLKISYAEQRDVNNVLIIAMTSDKGLCGAFNSNIIKAAVALTNDVYKNKKVTILPLGKKANEFFSKRDYSVISSYSDIFNNLSFENVREVAMTAMNSFTSGEFDQIVLVYNHFRNVATQDVTVEQFLPMKDAVSSTDDKKSSNVDYVLEPSPEFIVEELVPIALKTQFYKAVLESNASEHGARMTSMDKATENAGELLKDLKLMYNRSRQAAITNEILEIVAGANALKGN
jgi:F-type H+-transporting ATPase subunit gamma